MKSLVRSHVSSETAGICGSETAVQSGPPAPQRADWVGLLAAGAAHDLNNLLTVIHGHAATLGRALGAGHAGQAALAAIRSAADRCGALTAALAVLDQREPESATDAARIHAVIRAVAELTTRMSEPAVRVRLRLGAGEAPVAVPEAQAAQILLCLLTHAIDSLPHGGDVSITTRVGRARGAAARRDAGSAGLVIEVTASAAGARPFDLRIDLPSGAARPARRTADCALEHVAHVVDKLRGTFRSESDWGSGVRFELEFPLAGSAGSRATQGAADMRPLDGKTILFADDEDSVRMLAQVALARGGYQVLTASDGPDALRIVGQVGRNLTAIVMDASMPGMSGVEVLSRIKSEAPDIPVLLISGMAAEEFDSRGARHDAFLAKPYTPDALLLAVREMLSTCAAHASGATA